MLPAMTEKITEPIIIVQHLPVGFAAALVQHLQGILAVPVHLTAPGMTIERGAVYLADGGRQLGIHMSAGELRCADIGSDPIGGHTPAADALFCSAAKLTNIRICAVVLTGMGRDGADGALELRQQGAHVLAQDEATSVVWGMPGATTKNGAAHKTLPLPEIAQAAYVWSQQS